MVRNIVKLMGPGASLIMPSRYSSVGFFPVKQNQHRVRHCTDSPAHLKSSEVTGPRVQSKSMTESGTEPMSPNSQLFMLITRPKNKHNSVRANVFLWG